MGIPNRTVATALERSGTFWSLFLSGGKGLSYGMQAEVFHLFELFDELAAQSPVPVDFRQAERIRELWVRRKQQLAKNDAIRFARKLEARAEKQESGGP